MNIFEPPSQCFRASSIVVVLLVVINQFSCLAQSPIYPVTSPWEQSEVIPYYKECNCANYEKSTLKLVGENAIHFYQNHISCNSIARCPFRISCSQYAYAALNKYGPILGLCYYIDRNLYRENSSSFFNYEFYEDSEGSLKLDDSFYLNE
jgi:putative component of membrane protein insertase Oxa1/YidC/SpoIIIJ protein YidD